MSEQIITDDEPQATDIRGFLRKLRKGEPLNTEATSLLLNRIYNILESLAGEGCQVDKPLDCEGLGWRIIVDGCHSDLEPIGRVPMPFEFIAVDNAWHIWVKDAEVVLNNYHATKADNLQTAGDGQWTSATFAPNSNVYLYVFESSATETKHGPNCYSWNVSTGVPTGALASILLGRVASSTLAVQNARGNQIFYTFADSEIIKHDNQNAVMHINTNSTSGAMSVDDNLAFVVRTGGVLRYYKATDLLKAAFKKFEELIREPDPELDPSELMPIGDETYEEWEARIKEEIRTCLIMDGWPYMPEFGSAGSMWEEDSSSTFSHYGGWGVFDGPNNKFYSYWRGIDADKLTAKHIPPRKELDAILDKMEAIKDRIEALTTDPDGPRKSKLQELSDTAQEAYGAAVEMMGELATVDALASDLNSRLEEIEYLGADCAARAQALAARQAAIDADVTDLEGRI